MDAVLDRYPRYLQQAMDEALLDTPVVCLLGPRQCGKSTLARQQKRLYLSLDDSNLLHAALNDPGGFVSGLPERVTIDEVQRVPELLLAIKKSVDEDRKPGRFLLTGSANLMQLPRLADSLAGRMECLYLQPLSEAEKHHGDGQFLTQWLAGDFMDVRMREDSVEVSRLVRCVVEGGYPEPIGRSAQRARQWYRQYLRAVVERDVQDVANVRDSGEIARLLEVLAHQTGGLLNVSGLSVDLRLDRQTVERYLSVLERLFLIRRLDPWHRNSAKRLIKTQKLHLVDSGLAAALSGLAVEDWNAKRDKFGHLLESFVLQQLITQAGWSDSDVRFWHYRDKDQVEVDVVVTQGSKVWGAEVKASATLQNGDGKGLRRLKALAGKDFQSGIVFYDGSSVLPIGDGMHAVPLEFLWAR